MTFEQYINQETERLLDRLMIIISDVCDCKECTCELRVRARELIEEFRCDLAYEIMQRMK